MRAALIAAGALALVCVMGSAPEFVPAATCAAQGVVWRYW